MNGKYLERIEKAFGQNRIIEHTVNLLSMDGTDEYGTSTDKVSLLTIDQYRKYRKVLGKNMDNWWWLITPSSTASGDNSCCVLCVGTGGNVGCVDCDYAMCVRPFFKIQS